MRIVMLSDVEWGGGAAVAAGRLAEGLVARGHKVIRIFQHARPGDWSWESMPLTPAFGHSRIFRAVRGVLTNKGRQLWNRSFTERWLQRALEKLKPDAINVHNLHGAGWSASLVRACLGYAPTVWTLHDQWSFTGRCAYSNDCTKFLNGCDASCPTAGEYPVVRPSAIAGEWRAKSHVLADADDRLVGVTPSGWLSQVAKAGLWKKGRVDVIPYGLPLSVYAPLDRKVAREALGIENTDAPVLLCAAHSLGERRKGTHLLLEALKDVGGGTLLTFGAGKLSAPDGVRLHQLGWLDHERTKALAYNAADVLVHPSLADNLPCTVMEAIACGTPVVAFPHGGVSDMVRPGVTGWLAAEASAPTLAAAIKEAIADNRRESMRSRCREIAVAEYGLDLQAERYERLFASLISRGRGIHAGVSSLSAG